MEDKDLPEHVRLLNQMEGSEFRGKTNDQELDTTSNLNVARKETLGNLSERELLVWPELKTSFSHPKSDYEILTKIDPSLKTELKETLKNLADKRRKPTQKDILNFFDDSPSSLNKSKNRENKKTHYLDLDDSPESKWKQKKDTQLESIQINSKSGNLKASSFNSKTTKTSEKFLSYMHNKYDPIHSKPKVKLSKKQSLQCIQTDSKYFIFENKKSSVRGLLSTRNYQPLTSWQNIYKSHQTNPLFKGSRSTRNKTQRQIPLNSLQNSKLSFRNSRNMMRLNYSTSKKPKVTGGSSKKRRATLWSQLRNKIKGDLLKTQTKVSFFRKKVTVPGDYAKYSSKSYSIPKRTMRIFENIKKELF